MKTIIRKKADNELKRKEQKQIDKQRNKHQSKKATSKNEIKGLVRAIFPIFPPSFTRIFIVNWIYLVTPNRFILKPAIL